MLHGAPSSEGLASSLRRGQAGKDWLNEGEGRPGNVDASLRWSFRDAR